MGKKWKVDSKKQKAEVRKLNAESMEQNEESKAKGIQATPAKDDDSFDFGGLSDRNLKKNLGCG